MKYIILSADNNPSVYSVPDIVADNLKSYCIEFCDQWLWSSPHAAKYRIGDSVCYNEEDFIAYLNTWVFPDQKSKLIENLEGIQSNSDIPKPYRDYEWFNF